MRETVIHLSKDDLILSDVHSTEENGRGILRENTARKLRGVILMSNSDGSKEASKKKFSLKKKDKCSESSRMTSLIHLHMSLSDSDGGKVLIPLHQHAHRE